MKVGIIGIGSIGSIVAAGLDENGHRVRVNDADPQVERESPHTAIPKSELAVWADAIIITVPTPEAANGEGDSSIVAAVLDELQGTEAVVIIRSTMPPGHTERVVPDSMDVVYAPEFLRDRSGVEEFFNPDRVVIAGGSPKAQSVALDLFGPEAVDVDTTLAFEEYITAELGKEAHNAFFALKVSFANQVRLLAEEAGVSPTDVMDTVIADRRNTSSHLDPRLGAYGGSCLPKDTAALTYFGRESAAPTPLLDGIMATNAVAHARFEDRDIEGRWPHISIEGEHD